MSESFLGLSQENLKQVELVARLLSNGSWERGTLVQALIELEAPQLSPFSPRPLEFPDSRHDVPDYVFEASAWVRSHYPNGDLQSSVEARPLLVDGSTADPFSLGIACLLTDMCDKSKEEDNALSFKEMLELAFQYMRESAHKSDDGCLSHRTSHLSFWIDFIYMFPPCAAYYALTFPPDHPLHRHYLSYAYEQCLLYRKHCKRDQDGLWKHIVLGNGGKIDPWPWSSAQGWVAAGLLRVLATIKKSPLAAEYTNECRELFNWVTDILDSTMPHVAPSGMVRIYVDQPDMYEESAGTALLAAAAYRVGQMGLSEAYIPFAERARQAVYHHLDGKGYLTSVGAIDDERGLRENSAEGQSFVLLMEAAARDWHTCKWAPSF